MTTKRILMTLMLLIALLTLALSGVALAAKTSYTKGKGVDATETSFKFNVKNKDLGTTAAKGNITYDGFKAKADCLFVVGDVAHFEGIVTKASSDSEVEKGERVAFDVRDTEEEDGFTQTTPNDCTSILPGAPILEGDIVVFTPSPA